MKKIIFGITDLADVLFYELETSGIMVDAFCVNRAYRKESTHMGKPILASEELEKVFPSEELGVYLCIGYNSMNQVRSKVYSNLKERNIAVLSFVHNSALLMTENVGEGCLIFEHAVLAPYTKIGICNIFYPKSMISHHSVVGDFNFFAISSSVAGNVKVGNYCFIGNNATTKDGIQIKDYTLVGAGSYVNKDTECQSCIVPARSKVLENHCSTDFL